MVSPDEVRFILGVIGNVISCGLFLSPVPTMIKIYKKKSVEQFQVYPYIATLLNCAMWVLYGQRNVTHDNILVVTINGAGLGIEFIYVAFFLYYNTTGPRKKIGLYLLGEIIFTTVMILITYLVFHSTKGRTIFVGAVCVAFNVIMYGSPLFVMKKVIKTKSVKYMPFLLSLTNFLNGACWTAYACINNKHKVDPWLVVPNSIGAFFGAAQLVLYACYYNSNGGGPPPSDAEKPPKNVELVETS